MRRFSPNHGRREEESREKKEKIETNKQNREGEKSAISRKDGFVVTRLIEGVRREGGDVRSHISLIKICRLAHDRSRVKRNKKKRARNGYREL